MTTDEDPHRLLTVAEACERLRISRPTFYSLLRAGRLRTITIGQGQERQARRIPISAIERFVATELDAQRIGTLDVEEPGEKRSPK
jgi:excisionase family DNA binding protein